MTKPLLIAVDDDPGMAKLVKNAGELAGFDVRITTSVTEFQGVWEENNPSIILMDIIMPDMDGVELLMWLAEQKCSAPIILMSGYEGKFLKMAEHLGTAKGDNVIGTLTKPFKVDELEVMLKDVLAASRAIVKGGN